MERKEACEVTTYLSVPLSNFAPGASF